MSTAAAAVADASAGSLDQTRSPQTRVSKANSPAGTGREKWGESLFARASNGCG